MGIQQLTTNEVDYLGLEGLFSEFFPQLKSSRHLNATPYKLWKNRDDGSKVLVLELAGFPKEAVKVKIKNSNVYISAKHTHEELGELNYSKVFKLDGINTGTPKAKVKDGLLTLVFENQQKEDEELDVAVD